MILYLDLDGVVCDLDRFVVDRYPSFHTEVHENWQGKSDRFKQVISQNPDAFRNLELIPGAREAIMNLRDLYEIYFLSTPMWEHLPSWGHKREWLEDAFGDFAHKRLILTHRKDLALGDFLVDDNTWNGAGEFKGEHIHFGTDKFPDWPTTTNYLKAKCLV